MQQQSFGLKTVGKSPPGHVVPIGGEILCLWVIYARLGHFDLGPLPRICLEVTVLILALAMLASFLAVEGYDRRVPDILRSGTADRQARCADILAKVSAAFESRPFQRLNSQLKAQHGLRCFKAGFHPSWRRQYIISSDIKGLLRAACDARAITLRSGRIITHFDDLYDNYEFEPGAGPCKTNKTCQGSASDRFPCDLTDWTPMTDALSRLLNERDWILTDGATGTALFNMGLTSGDAPEMWNEEHPDRIEELYRGAVDAGSDLFLTNSFGGNASRLKLHGAEKRARELSRMAAEIGRNVADQAGRTVVVAGSMGPTGDIMEPMGKLTHALAVEMFHEQAEGLKEGGADVLWVETISAPEEYKAAAEAAGLADMPWCGTMSFDTAGRTMMGMTSVAMTKMVHKLAHPPLAYGANCGVGASDLLRTVQGFSSQGAALPIIAKGNAGIPKYHEGHIHYDGTPDLMAEYAVLARDCGATLIGGCCGTTPEHLRAMRHALETRPRGAAPELDHIAETIGGFSSPSDGTDGQGPARVRANRRKRA